MIGLQPPVAGCVGRLGASRRVSTSLSHRLLRRPSGAVGLDRSGSLQSFDQLLTLRIGQHAVDPGSEQCLPDTLAVGALSQRTRRKELLAQQSIAQQVVEALQGLESPPSLLVLSKIRLEPRPPVPSERAVEIREEVGQRRSLGRAGRPIVGRLPTLPRARWRETRLRRTGRRPTPGGVGLLRRGGGRGSGRVWPGHDSRRRRASVRARLRHSQLTTRRCGRRNHPTCRLALSDRSSSRRRVGRVRGTSRSANFRTRCATALRRARPSSDR